MIWVDWQAIDVASDHDTGLLLALLGAVVTALTEALEVGRIEEQRHIASVRLDVIRNASGHC